MPTPSLIEVYEKAAAQNAITIRTALHKAAQTMRRHLRDVAREGRAEGIIKAAQDRQCDLIVAGSYGRRGLTRLLLASDALKLTTLSSLFRFSLVASAKSSSASPLASPFHARRRHRIRPCSRARNPRSHRRHASRRAPAESVEPTVRQRLQIHCG